MKADVFNGITSAFANGIDLYMYYQNQSSTPWGATRDPIDFNEPKYAGLIEATGRLVTRTAGTTLQATIPVNPPDIIIVSDAILPSASQSKVAYCNASGNGTPSSCTLLPTTTPGTGFGFLVNVPKAGNYSFSLVLNNGHTIPAGNIDLDVDQKPVGNFTTTAARAGTPAQTLGPITATLSSGLHLVEILQVGTYSFSASSIVVTGS